METKRKLVAGIRRNQVMMYVLNKGYRKAEADSDSVFIHVEGVVR
jgi:hypothetical protein